MRFNVSFHRILLATVVTLCWGTQVSCCEDQPVLLQSTLPGATGQVGGTAILNKHFVGWRFSVSDAVAVEQVGGHLYESSDHQGNIFVALVRLASLTSTPVGLPFTESELVAQTTFQPGYPSTDILTPLSATLIPGSYALVFGTGQFGAMGEAGLVNNPDQPHLPPTSQTSYIAWKYDSSGSGLAWQSANAINMRFVVIGQEASFTADFAGDGDVDGADLTIWQGAYGANALGDTDGDGDSDSRDFLAWQRQYTGPSQGVPSPATIIPEPGGIVHILLAAACQMLRKPHRYIRLSPTSTLWKAD